MKLIIRYSNHEQKEIILSNEQGKQVQQALLKESKFIRLGETIINTSYVIGLFEGGEKIDRTDRLIASPIQTSDPKKVNNILQIMRENLKKKGIIK